MNEFKGTKRKWEITGRPFFDEDAGNIGSYYIATENKEQIMATVPAYESWGQTLETARANALIISKAPEMLEMLKEIVSEFDIYKSLAQGTSKCDAIMKAEQLIKEATEI